jgi:7-cyano-7-deazaguanine reductase
MTKDSKKNCATYSTLGKTTPYESSHNPNLLFAIARKEKRDSLGINQTSLPFYGHDSWNHYEVSWLNPKGKPMVATAQIDYDCRSPYIIESKSLKLYFNSLNNTHFKSMSEITATIKKDIEDLLKINVNVDILPLDDNLHHSILAAPPGLCIDGLDVSCESYTVTPNLLSASDEIIDETLYSNVLKSNCLVTKQPDWGTLLIDYKGPKISQAGLLQYIVSFRNHNEFHEQCIERIFIDIMQHCKPHSLTLEGRYSRRGGIDINPYRTTEKNYSFSNRRLIRQ